MALYYVLINPTESLLNLFMFSIVDSISDIISGSDISNSFVKYYIAKTCVLNNLIKLLRLI